MGDEELNFTEEEARPWVDDPQNQPSKSSYLGAVIAGCIWLLLLIVALIAKTGPVETPSDAGQLPAGIVLGVQYTGLH